MASQQVPKGYRFRSAQADKSDAQNTSQQNAPKGDAFGSAKFKRTSTQQMEQTDSQPAPKGDMFGSAKFKKASNPEPTPPPAPKGDMFGSAKFRVSRPQDKAPQAGPEGDRFGTAKGPQSGNQASNIQDSKNASPGKRKFAPVPVESSARSNRKSHDLGSTESSQDDLNGKSESSSTSHSSGDSTSSAPRRKRHVPEPIEISRMSNRRHVAWKGQQNHERSLSQETDKDTEMENTSGGPVRRKYQPMLVETAHRSHKSGDLSPGVLPEDRTNFSPSDTTFKTRPGLMPAPLPFAQTPMNSSNEVPTLQSTLPIRQGSIHPHNTTRLNTRQHSYREPELETIESSGSDSVSRSPKRPSHTSNSNSKDASHSRRESDDKDVSEYLLSLAARAAEKQLREQEVVVFPNTDLHEPVNHFVGDEESDEDSSGQSSRTVGRDKRSDSDEEQSALRELQKHGERLQEGQHQEAQSSITHQKKNTAFNVEFDNEAKQEAWESPTAKAAKTFRVGENRRNADMKRMRDAASPPMLGGDIDFPRCPSPENARFDVTQGSDFIRSSMCYLTNRDEGDGGLWNADTGATPGAKLSPMQARTNDQQSSRANTDGSGTSTGGGGGGGGLWGGFCTESNSKMLPMPTGLVTPRRTPSEVKGDSFSNDFAIGVNARLSVANLTHYSGNSPRPSQPQTPRTSRSPTSPEMGAKTPKTARGGAAKANGMPTHSPNTSITSLPPVITKDAPLGAAAPLTAPKSPPAISPTSISRVLQSEFPDGFITQVFNYLSLGFPALARKFDEELSRISGIPIEQLREDDKLAMQRGYLRLGEGERASEVEEGRVVKEEDCKRWCALRVYVREWGRQCGVVEVVEAFGGMNLEEEDAKEGVLLNDDKTRGVWRGRAEVMQDPHRAWGLPGRKGSWGQ